MDPHSIVDTFETTVQIVHVSFIWRSDSTLKYWCGAGISVLYREVLLFQSVLYLGLTVLGVCTGGLMMERLQWNLR